MTSKLKKKREIVIKIVVKLHTDDVEGKLC